MISNSFLKKENVCGLDCISDEIEGEFSIYWKLFVLLYADDTVLFSELHQIYSYN